MKRIFLVTIAVIIIVIVVVFFAYFLLQIDTSESENLNVTQNPFLWMIEGDNPSVYIIQETQKGSIVTPLFLYP